MTPWELAGKSEHSHQRALFAWANCAALYGFAVAEDERGYTLAGREKLIDAWKASSWGNKPFSLEPVPALKLLFAIHNQGHGDQIRGGRAKAEGVKAGVPDLFLPVPRGRRVDLGGGRLSGGVDWHHGLFIELKLPNYTPSAVKPAQREWHVELDALGYRVAVCGGWEVARAVLIDYLT